MERANDHELREELTRLEAEEARVSAQRRHLHQQIDFGYATDEARAREREVSDERQALHNRIDELRALLGLSEPESVTEPTSLEERFSAGPSFGD